MRAGLLGLPGLRGFVVVASALASSVTEATANAAPEPSGAISTSAASMASAPASASPAGVTLDRTLVRFVSAETGGSARPRFFSEREVAFFTRLEAVVERADLPEGLYPERFVRAAVDRLVARAMLANLLVQRGSEVPDLARRAQEARADLEARVGGASVLEALLASECLGEDELAGFLRDQVRAAAHIDRALASISTVSDDQLREAHRSASHPFRGTKLEEVRPRLRVWLVTERLRAAELEFLQSARGRVKISTTAAVTPSHPPAMPAPEPPMSPTSSTAAPSPASRRRP
jgi:hypothetical protein